MFLRRFARPLMMMENVKETTTMGIVQSELNVIPNARKVLIDLYSKTLDEIKGIPEDDRSRKAVESSTRYRLKVCEEEEDLEKIKKRIGSGQVDELIDEAKEDLWLMVNKKIWKVWSVTPIPKPGISPGIALTPKFFEIMNNVVLKSEELSKKEAEERLKKEAKERLEKEILAEFQSRFKKICQNSSV